jgi:hypothetical protein
MTDDIARSDSPSPHDPSYEPPQVEDLDTGQGPIATAPGTVPQSLGDSELIPSAPREL